MPDYSPNSNRQVKCTAKEEVSPVVRCAENIALLELLDQMPKYPTSPRHRQSSEERRDDVERKLSKSQEKELATNLAFLAAISDDYKHVMAVCIEELPEVGGCQVLIAINKELPTSGDETLRKVQRGFQQIFGRLREISLGENSPKFYLVGRDCTSLTWASIHVQETRVATEQAVFNDIVALCHWRILSRLRSSKSEASRKSRKRFIGLHLQVFVDVPWQDRIDKSNPQMTISQLEEHRHRCRSLLAKLDDLEAADVVRHEDLSRLVQYIARFMELVPLARLLGLLTDQDMDPTSRDWLLSCLSKIARYRECARLLCRRAAKIPLMRDTTVVLVQNATQAGDGPLQMRMTVDLEQSLSRFQHKGKPVQIRTLPYWLQKRLASTQGSFSDKVRDTLQTAKVHAEIQLLAHYDNVGDGVIPPRMIVATKDACSLCYSLIDLHGKYELPKSHGKLYGKWRLPAIYQEGPLQRSLNSFLEKQILTTLQRLIPLSGRPLMVYLNESNISHINISASTLAAPSSLLVSDDLRLGVAALAYPSKDDATGSRADQKSSEIDFIEHCHVEGVQNNVVAESVNGQESLTADTSTIGPGGEDTHAVGVEVADHAGTVDAQAYVAQGNIGGETGSDDTGATSHSSMPSDRQPLSEEVLKPGQTITFEACPDSKNRFCTKRIDLSIDDSSGRFSFTWLSGNEAEAVLRTKTNAVLDVETISSGVDMILTKDAEGNTYFAYGGEVVMICTLATPGSSS